MECVTMGAIKKEFSVTEDDLRAANVPILETPNLLFKHVPTQVTYKHLVTACLPAIRLNQKTVHAERSQLD